MRKQHEYCTDCHEMLSDEAEQRIGICRECLANQSKD